MSATKARRGKLKRDRLAYVDETVRMFDEAKRGLLALIEEYPARRQRIHDDYRDTDTRDYSGLRDQLLEEAQAEADRQFRELSDRGQLALTQAAIEAQRTRRDTRVDEAALARVRRMLDQGTSPLDIFQRARRIGDAQVIAALRQELLWLGLEEDAARPGHERLSRAFARLDGTTPEAEAFEELRCECDRALAELDGPGGREARGIVHVREESQSWEALRVLALAALGKGGSLSTARMAYAMAENDAGESRLDPNLSLSGEQVSAGAS